MPIGATAAKSVRMSYARLRLSAGAVLDHDAALQPLADAGCHDAGEKIVRPAGRKADDEAQRTIGEIYRLRMDIRSGSQRQSGDAGKRGAATKLDHRETMLGSPRFGRKQNET